MKDYYNLLGLSRSATSDEIKRAYRKLALQYHPDRNQGSKASEERFKEITQAYEVLRDVEKRRVYDQHGEQGLRRGPDGFSAGFDFSDAIEIFMRDFGGFGGLGDIFGQRPRRSRRGRAKGENLKVPLLLTLVDVAHGARKEVTVRVLEACDRCGGSGGASGRPPVACSTCGGSGEERVVQRSILGQLVSVQPCRRCLGEGMVIEEPCLRCHGEGRVRGEVVVEVEIPPGVTSDNYITLRGQGSVGLRGGPRGDVIVLLKVESDERFVREGFNLVHERPITFTQAALGNVISVPTVDGSATVTVPAGIQSGVLLRLRGQGLPTLEGTARGDLLVRIVVWTPERLTEEQAELLGRMRTIESPAPDRIDGEDRKGFWSRVKEALTG